MMSGRFRPIFAVVGISLLLTGPVPAQTPTAPRLAAAPTAAVNQPPSVPSAAPKLERVIVTFKTHFDIGYTDLAANVVQPLPHGDDRPGAGGGRSFGQPCRPTGGSCG